MSIPTPRTEKSTHSLAAPDMSLFESFSRTHDKDHSSAVSSAYAKAQTGTTSQSDARRAEKEKDSNLKKQASLKQRQVSVDEISDDSDDESSSNAAGTGLSVTPPTHEIDEKILRLEKNLAELYRQKKEKVTDALEKELRTLKQERALIQGQLPAPQGADRSELSVDMRMVLLDDDSAESSTDGPADHLSYIRNTVIFLAERVCEKERLTALHINGEDQSAELAILDNEIGPLQQLLTNLLMAQTVIFGQATDASPAKKHELSMKADTGNISGDEEPLESGNSGTDPVAASDLTQLIVRRTTTKRRQPEAAPQADHKDSVPNTTHTTASMPDDIETFSSAKARKKITAIDNQILEYSDKANAYLLEINALRKKLNLQSRRPASPRGKESDAPDATVEARKKIKALKELHIRSIAAIGKLYLQRSAVDKPFMASPEKEGPEPESVAATISKRTRDLESEYATLLKNHTDQVNADPAGEWKDFQSNLIGGAGAFASSFLIANTIGRFAPPLFNLIALPVVAGFLHTVVATPTAKSFMRRVWRGKPLAEANNYFRLCGAYWSDTCRGQTDVAKYASKNPEKNERITIKERLGEERPLNKILGDRYKTEELPYSAYSTMYSIKGVLEATLWVAWQPDTLTKNGVDALLHGFAGACSGAFYLMQQQDARSQLPGNTADVLPTPEIFAAQAKALQSRKQDLEQKIANLKKIDTEDPHIKPLSIELAKTEKKLIMATAKSGKFSGWGYDFLAQFKKDVLVDTLADVFGRILSLYPSAGVTYLTAGLRASNNPVLVALGHIVPAVILIVPPGFQARGVYGGMIRAALQAMVGTGPAPEADEESSDEVRVSLSEGDESDTEEGPWEGRERDTDAAKVL